MREGLPRRPRQGGDAGGKERGGAGRAVTGVGLEVDHPVGDAGEEHSLREQVGHLHQHLRRRKGHFRIVAGRALPVCSHSSACEPYCDRFFYHLQSQDGVTQPQGPPAATLAADLCTQVQAKTNTEHTPPAGTFADQHTACCSAGSFHDCSVRSP